MDKRTLVFKDKTIEITKGEDGDYYDSEGTKYPALLFDEGYCGVAPFTTGKLDPFHKRACQPHDKAFSRMMVGYTKPDESNVTVFKDFTADVFVTMLQGAYAVVMGVPYILIGGVGGMVRWAIKDREK